jgi:membrane protease YdiL (CAAX protease family)
MILEVIHFVAFALAVVGPILDIILTPRLKASQNPNKRLYNYAGIVGLSVLFTVLGVQWLGSEALQSPFGPLHPALTALSVGIAGLLIWALGRPVLKIVRKPELRAKTHRQLAVIDFMVPQSVAERRAFILVCLSAGICEEILFRNFLIRYFQLAPWGWPLWLAVVVSLILFGLNHLYQGWRGALSTVIMAAMFAVMVAGFGSLIPAMVLHALVDFRMLVLTLPIGHPFRDAQAESPTPA